MSIFTVDLCCQSYSQHTKSAIAKLAHDAWDFNCYFFSQDLLKVALGSLPLYLSARQLDAPLHRCFYNKKYHINMRQLPDWCTKIADRAVLALPMIIIGSLTILADDEELKTAARIFVLSLPFTWALKSSLKTLRGNFCLRPSNQYFKKAYGGFPSGHMLEATYLATLFGLRFGPAWGIPLAFGAAFLGINFIVCNRHYLSQLVVGAALGLACTIASNKLINQKMASRALLLCSFCSEKKAFLITASHTF